jgi:hypothetical protein
MYRFHKGSIIITLDTHVRFNPEFPALRDTSMTKQSGCEAKLEITEAQSARVIRPSYQWYFQLLLVIGTSMRSSRAVK